MQGVRVTREEVKLPSDKVGTAQMDEPCIAQNDLGSKRCPAAAKLPDPKMEVAERIFALPSYDRGIMRNPPKRFLPLTENDPLFQRLRSHFLDSWYGPNELSNEADVTVSGIFVIYNPMLADTYRQEVATMRQRYTCAPLATPLELDQAIHVCTDGCGGVKGSVNEALLYHGCDWHAASQIVEEGFNTGLVGANAGVDLGHATFFTSGASKADFYTTAYGWDDQSGKEKPGRIIFVGRVALGNVYCEKGHGNIAHQGPPEGYDSVSRCGHDEFVIHRSTQMVPQYCVVYEHKPTCICRSCTKPDQREE